MLTSPTNVATLEKCATHGWGYTAEHHINPTNSEGVGEGHSPAPRPSLCRIPALWHASWPPGGFQPSTESPLCTQKYAVSSAEVVLRYSAEKVAAGQGLGPFLLEHAQAAAWHLNMKSAYKAL
jgi:hypothetical protein